MSSRAGAAKSPESRKSYAWIAVLGTLVGVFVTALEMLKRNSAIAINIPPNRELATDKTTKNSLSSIATNAFTLFKEAFADWREDKAPKLAASLAFFTAFSVAPLLIVVIAIAGLVFGHEAAQGQIISQIEGMVGAEAAAGIQSILENARKPSSGIIALVIGIGTLLWGATGLFSEIQDSLNTV